MSKWKLLVAAGLALVSGGLIAGEYMLGGCRNLSTTIRQRVTYSGPASAPAQIAAEDWPRYRGPRGDGISRETAVLANYKGGELKQLWAADVGLGYSSPVAVGGIVYLFSLNDGKETLTAFDAHTGRIVWSHEDSAGWERNYPGTRATPTIDAAHIYTLGGRGDLRCRELATGRQLWTINALETTGSSNIGWGTSSCPLIDGPTLYVQAGKGGPIALAIDKTSGAILWKSQATGVAGYAEPVLADVEGSRQLIVFGGQEVVGMEPATGRTLWSVPWVTSYDVNAATPIVRDGLAFVTSGYGHGCMMLRLSKGGAQRVWESKVVQGKYPTPILDGDALYANSEGTLKCISWPDGAVKWEARDPRLRLGAGGTLVRIGDRLLTLSEKGMLSWLRATPAGHDLIGRTQVVEGTEIWATPLLYGRRIFVKGQKELICFDGG